MEQTKKLINGEWLTEEECFEEHGGLIWVGVRRTLGGNVLSPFELEDLMSEGAIGLMQAYRNFDSTKGFKFSTYAVRTIWGHVMMYRNRHTSIIRKSRNMGDLRRKMGDDLTDMTAKELSKKYSISTEEVDIVRSSFQSVISLENIIYEGGNSDSGEITLQDMAGIDDDVSNLYVTDFSNTLTDRQRKIITLLTEGYSQKDIAITLNLSQPQISRDLTKIKKEVLKWENKSESY